jgi:catechol 2,3-dioxygenase-like lactoylglutathione lyase family enzyme
MNITKIKETCLYVKDLALAKSFYEGKLGLPLLSYVPGKHLFLRAGSSVLLCFNPADSRLKESPPPHFGGGRQHFAFEVPASEYQTAKSEIESKGITIIDVLEWQSGSESFYFEDPEGNVLEIVPDAGVWD